MGYLRPSAAWSATGCRAPLAGVPREARTSATPRFRAGSPASGQACADDAGSERTNLASSPPHSGAAKQRRKSRRFGSSDRLSPPGRFFGRQDCENSLLEACNPRRFVSRGDRDELGEAVQFGQTRRTEAGIKARIGTTSRRHVSSDQSGAVHKGAIGKRDDRPSLLPSGDCRLAKRALTASKAGSSR